MSTLAGALKSNNAPASWLGFRVEVRFPISVKLEDQGVETKGESPEVREGRKAGNKKPAGPAKQRSTIIMNQLMIDVTDDGTFTVDLDGLAPGEITLAAIGTSGERLARSAISSTNVSQPVTLTVNLVGNTPIPPRDSLFDGRRPRLTGRLISGTDPKLLVGRRITVLGVLSPTQGTATGTPVVLGSARADATGYFSTDYPIETSRTGAQSPRSLTSAFALVEGAKDANGNSEIQIGLTTLGNMANVLPLEIALIVTADSNGSKSDECECHQSVPRTPEATDLVSSDAFSEDLGIGGCPKLTTPNRTLEEFSFYTAVRTTDPDFIAQGEATVDVSGAVISAKTRMISTVSPSLLGRRRSRAVLSASNAINWDNPDVNAPAFFEATSVAHGHLLQFKQVWRADGYSLGDLLYSLPLAPGQKKQIAIVDWERRETGLRTESTTFSEGLDNLVSRDRDISEIVSTTLRERAHGESEALTIGSAHGSGASGGTGGFGGLAATSMSGGYSQSSATQDSARELVASSVQRIHDQTMQVSSAVRSLRSSVVQSVSQGERVTATTEVVANHNHCHALTIEYFEVLRHFKVTTELADVRECLYIPLPLSPFVPEKIQRWRDLLGNFLRKRDLSGAFDANDRIIANFANADFPLKRFADEPISSLQGHLTLYVRAPRTNPSATETASELVDHAGEYLPDVVEKIAHTILDVIGRASDNQGPPPKPQLFLRLRLTDGTVIEPTMSFTLIDEFAPNKPLRVVARIAGTLSPQPTRAQVEFVEIGWSSTSTDGLPEGCELLLVSAAMRYRTAHIEHALFEEKNAGAGLGTNAARFDAAFLSPLEMRNPKDEDYTLQRRLQQHLNEHLEYYHKAIWWGMDSDRRFMLLDGYLAPTRPGETQRSLAAVVDNKLIGFVGNSMVMPVGHGIQMDPSYSVGPRAKLTDLYPPTLLPPSRISLPTKGVFAEAIMGECNSCEQKDETRFWRWQEVPTGDEPMAILPPTTDGRRSEVTNLTPTTFPAPIVSIQAGADLPDPTGLAAALKVLGTADLFRDLTGLGANQSNALAALQSNAEAVKYMAGEASKLAQQKQMKDGGIDKSIQTIQQAQRDGLIDQKQATELSIEALKGLIGTSGKSSSSEKSPLKELIDSATNSSKSKVSYEAGGESLSVEKGSSSGSTPAVTPSGQEALIQQVAFYQEFEAWRDLIEWEVPGPISQGLLNRGFAVQRIADGAGQPTNVDYFAIEVDKLPSINGTQLTPEQTLEEVRQRLEWIKGGPNAPLIDPNITFFRPYDVNIDKSVWYSSNPPGAALYIGIPALSSIFGTLGTWLFDNAAVVVSSSGSRHWTFSTIKTSLKPGSGSGEHPVSGNRRFGIAGPSPSGAFYIYTKGVDRTSDSFVAAAGTLAYEEGSKVWRSFQTGVAAFINANGGNATVLRPVIHRPNWMEIELLLKRSPMTEA